MMEEPTLEEGAGPGVTKNSPGRARVHLDLAKPVLRREQRAEAG